MHFIDFYNIPFVWKDEVISLKPMLHDHDYIPCLDEVKERVGCYFAYTKTIFIDDKGIFSRSTFTCTQYLV